MAPCGPRRSANWPAATVPTSQATMNALKAHPKSDNPPSERTAVGSTGTTPMPSAANEVTERRMPTVSARRSGANTPVLGASQPDVDVHLSPQVLQPLLSRTLERVEQGLLLHLVFHLIERRYVRFAAVHQDDDRVVGANAHGYRVRDGARRRSAHGVLN